MTSGPAPPASPAPRVGSVAVWFPYGSVNGDVGWLDKLVKAGSSTDNAVSMITRTFQTGAPEVSLHLRAGRALPALISRISGRGARAARGAAIATHCDVRCEPAGAGLPNNAI